jgi:galactitol-specific phosphotransferase system IIB component
MLSSKGQYNDAFVSLCKAHGIFVCGYGELHPQTTSTMIKDALHKKQEKEGVYSQHQVCVWKPFLP